MIVSFSKRFVYIRCRKVAGTATEIDLSRYCSAEDIITPVVVRDELVRGEAGGRRPQNYEVGGVATFYNHMSAMDLRALLSAAVWAGMYSIAVERNPWEKVASMFFHRLGRRTHARTLPEFVASGEFLQARNFALYTDPLGVPVVDRVLLYENLEQELASFYENVGIPAAPQLLRVKSQFRPSSATCADLYNDDSKRRVAQAFGDEIELMKYTFPEAN